MRRNPLKVGDSVTVYGRPARILEVSAKPRDPSPYKVKMCDTGKIAEVNYDAITRAAPDPLCVAEARGGAVPKETLF